MEVREKYNVYMKSKRWEFWKAKKRKGKNRYKKVSKWRENNENKEKYGNLNKAERDTEKYR